MRNKVILLLIICLRVGYVTGQDPAPAPAPAPAPEPAPTPAPAPAAEPAPATEPAPVPVPAPGQEPAATTAASVINAPPSPGKLNEVCAKSHMCAENQGLQCVNSGENNGLMRCRCDNGYYHFSADGGEAKCYPIQPATEDKCKDCYNNMGVCIKDNANYNCSCPASRAGLNCEFKIVNVTCTRNFMSVCFDPVPKNINANWTGGWRMYVDGKSSVNNCSGRAVEIDNSTCVKGGNLLPISIANKAELDLCGTINSTDSSNVKLSNRITVANSSGEPVLSFIVFCSFQQFSNEKFVGVGIVNQNGNENGGQVDAVISLKILDRIGNPLVPGSSIMVGDQVQFSVHLGRGDVYSSLSVQTCTASSSPFMPDSTAETRALISYGCPISGESTSESWFFTTMADNKDYAYSIKSKPVKMFKLASSNIVYIHCTIQVCLIGQTSCTLKKKEDCTGVNKRSVDHIITKRAATSTGYTYTTIVVNDPRDNVTTNTIVYAVVFSVLIAAVVIALVVAAAIYAMKGNGGRSEKNQHPEVFAMPRVTATTDRI